MVLTSWVTFVRRAISLTKSSVAVGVIQGGYPRAGGIQVVSLRYPAGISDSYLSHLTTITCPMVIRGPTTPEIHTITLISPSGKINFFSDQLFPRHQLSSHQDVAVKNLHLLTDVMQTCRWKTVKNVLKLKKVA